MNTSEVLNRAADLIEERGWTKGSWGGTSDAPLCLEGGIIAAQGGTEFVADGAWQQAFWACPAYRAVKTHIGLDLALDEGGLPLEDVWGWNDTPGRTAAEVIEVLRACAVIEAAREEQDAAWETYAEVVSA